MAHQLRLAGIATETYPDCKRLARQLKYADRSGHRFALIIGSDEFASGVCQVKDLAAATSTEVPLDGEASAVIAYLTQQLA